MVASSTLSLLPRVSISNPPLHLVAHELLNLGHLILLFTVQILLIRALHISHPLAAGTPTTAAGPLPGMAPDQGTKRSASAHLVRPFQGQNVLNRPASQPSATRDTPLIPYTGHQRHARPVDGPSKGMLLGKTTGERGEGREDLVGHIHFNREWTRMDANMTD